jgi:hypothetical protein
VFSPRRALAAAGWHEGPAARRGPSERRTWWTRSCGKLPVGQLELAGGGPSTRQTNQAHLALD